MTEHYYTENPTSESRRKIIQANLRGKPFVFYTDRGVFSKDTIDFGTRLLIEQFQFPAVEGDLADIGCGYGPIGISLAKETKRQVYLVDVNERAVELAKENAKLNEVENVSVLQSDLFSELRGFEFAAIVTNPPIRAGKQVVFSLYEQSFAHLKRKGELWVVIQKKQGAPSTKEKLKQWFAEVEVVHKKKGYYIIRARKN